MAGYGQSTASGQHPSTSSQRHRNPHLLAQHEREVAALICQGLTNGQIAQRLSLSPSAIRRYIEWIYEKLDVHSRQELIDTVARVEFFAAGLSAARQKPKSLEQIGDLDGYQLKPDPLAAQSLAELEDFLRKFWVWAGRPSSRKLAARSGGAFSHATISKLVYDKPEKPILKLQYLLGFVRACGIDEDEQRCWVTAWRRVAEYFRASDQHEQAGAAQDAQDVGHADPASPASTALAAATPRIATPPTPSSPGSLSRQEAEHLAGLRAARGEGSRVCPAKKNGESSPRELNTCASYTTPRA
jgi:DNA-binding CsgD family transcriptional regulator